VVRAPDPCRDEEAERRPAATTTTPSPEFAVRPEPGDRFVVRPGGPLHGTVRAGGAKNSALKLMAACLLAEGRHVLAGVPRIVDVDIMAEVLTAVGARVERLTARAGEPGDIVVETPAELVPEAPYELVERMRASVVVLGPLLARAGEARVSLPGGDDFGNRPIDIHLMGLSHLGAVFTTDHGYVVGHVPRALGGRLVGSRVVFEYPSHTATDNVLMAAVLAKGTTVIENAAREPEVTDLARLLGSMGARISGAGTSHIEIEGVEALTPTQHRVIPDRVVAATFMAAVGMTGGDVVVEDARADHMDMLIQKLGAMGLVVSQAPEGLRVVADGHPRSVDVATLPYPGVATDYKPFVVTLLSVGDSVGIVSENLFQGRFRYVDELRRMGADIRTEGHHAVVRGVPRLSGAPVRAPDLRAGAALVLAGLRADGETVVMGAHHVDRGYEDLQGKLRALGACVERS
jgi:UDP-N-acetylglucosamine 1-carboxyvinyltransferase